MSENQRYSEKVAKVITDDRPQIDQDRPYRANRSPISPTDAELDVIDKFAGACRVTPVENEDTVTILVSDLTAEIRRHRQVARGGLVENLDPVRRPKVVTRGKTPVRPKED